MHTTLNTLLIVLIIAWFVGLIVSIVGMRRQQRHERDQSLNDATVKHPMSRNTILIGYILLPFVMAGLAALFIFLFQP